MNTRKTAAIFAAAAAAAFTLAAPAVAQAAPRPAAHASEARPAATPATEWYFPDATTYNYICANPQLWDGSDIWGHDSSEDVVEYIVDWTEDGPSSTYLEMSFYRGDGTNGSFGMYC